MGRYAQRNKPELVVANRADHANFPDDHRAPHVRVSAQTPQELLDIVEGSTNVGAMLVALDEATVEGGRDDLDVAVALAAVLIERGVVAFETRHVIAVRRLFDSYAAIGAGDIGVLG